MKKINVWYLIACCCTFSWLPIKLLSFFIDTPLGLHAVTILLMLTAPVIFIIAISKQIKDSEHKNKDNE